MSFLLDTNVVSELRKHPHRIDPAVAGWAGRRAMHELFLSVVTVVEIELGVARQERKDPAAGSVLRAWFERGVLEGFTGRILAIDVPVARRAATYHVPDPRPDRDAYIAATAEVHGLVVVTRNTADFDPLGCQVINPWSRRNG